MTEMPSGCADLASLFPDCVRVFCMRVQDAPLDIRDEERPCVEKAVEKRRREFSAGRCCAREALRQLGCDTGPIGQDRNGAPRWPDGIVGAITHSSTCAAAAAARTKHLLGIGIDLETVSRVSEMIAGKILTDLFQRKSIEGAGDVKRKQYIQWSILQHYEICQTPLLDLTSSPRVACTFAITNNEDAFGYVYMLGLPYVTNRISVNSEHDIVNIRLLSICPPAALRPYFQEGYLAGTTDITDEYESKNELDFNNRLIAKFKIPTNNNFWGDDFKVLPYNSLYPEEDPIEMLCAEVKEEVEIFFKPGEAGEFLGKWSQFENYLTEKLLKRRKGLNFNEALKLARSRDLIDDYALDQIEKLKRFRSELLYSPKKIKRKSIGIYIEMINSLLSIWSSKL